MQIDLDTRYKTQQTRASSYVGYISDFILPDYASDSPADRNIKAGNPKRTLWARVNVKF